MAIPKEILSVKRPVNTVVIAYGKNKDRYAVRQRVGCKSVDGRHIPINGPTIGHIIDGRYVASSNEPSPVSQSDVELKDWANVKFCDDLFADIIADLRKFYNTEDVHKIYCIALLRVCNPGISDYELKEAYENSFLSEMYPGVALHRNTVSDFLENLGKACSRIVEFMRLRAESVNPEHHVLIDGTLKSDESKINTLSDFSRKAKTKGSRDISVIYALDLETMEPICSKCYPGNMIDARAYGDFLEENHLHKGLVIADKGFPMKAAEKEFKEHKDLHYLNPIKRNSKLVETYKMLDYTGVLKDRENVLFKKAKCKGTNKWLYSFRDATRAAKEEQDYLRRAKAKGEYDDKNFKQKQESFGVVIFECDLDLSSEVVYKAYELRWEVEVVMRFYKSACEFDRTRVHNDYSVIGSEFIDFLSSLLTCRLIKAFDKVDLLKKATYKKLMSTLRRCKKIRINGEWKLIRINVSNVEILQKIGLLDPPVAPEGKRKVGRPKQSV